MLSSASLPAAGDASSVIETLTEDEDDAYFGSYAHFSIHQEMLKVFNSFNTE